MKIKDKKIIVVIPVYNEEEIINTVIKNLMNKLINFNFKILVLNDGSIDNTIHKLEAYKSDDRIIIINKENEGHGQTLVKGYNLTLKMDVDYVMQIDSDDQIPIHELEKLTIHTSNYNFILGYRYNRSDSLIRIIITNLLKIIILIRHRVYIKDSNIPFRLISKDFLKNNLHKVQNSKVPNILLSILAAKKSDIKQVKTYHKKRDTGVESLRNFKLIFFCLQSFIEVLFFKT